MKKKSSRLIVVLVFLGAGAFFYWQLTVTPTENQLTFVLTDVELEDNGGLLRHENVTRLDATVMSETGEQVATIVHMRPGAVANPAPLTLPDGAYTFHIILTFDTKRTHGYHRIVDLKGDKATIHL